MITTGTKHTVVTGEMEVAWREWIRFAQASRSWLGWKQYWTQAFQEKCKLYKLTGTTCDGVANQAVDVEMGNNMVTALDNLANATQWNVWSLQTRS